MMSLAPIVNLVPTVPVKLSLLNGCESSEVSIGSAYEVFTIPKVIKTVTRKATNTFIASPPCCTLSEQRKSGYFEQG